MNVSSNPPDKIKLIQGEVDQVKNIMHKNIESISSNLDNLETLQDKTGYFYTLKTKNERKYETKRYYF